MRPALSGEGAGPSLAASDGAAAGMAALLRPRSIVIVGASEKSRWSQTAFENLTRSGFGGAVHLVNRRGGTVHGQAAATSIAAVGADLDLGIVIVPAAAVVEAIDDLGAAGVRAAVVLTSGFAETGPAGAALQAEFTASARRHGIRLLGPNSLGFINFAENVQAWTTPVRAPSKQAGVAIVSQSGATAFFLAELGYQQDLGLSYVIATGNEADLDASAFVDFLVDDPDTRAIALFVETVRDPARFLRLPGGRCARASRSSSSRSARARSRPGRPRPTPARSSATTACSTASAASSASSGCGRSRSCSRPRTSPRAPGCCGKAACASSRTPAASARSPRTPRSRRGIPVPELQAAVATKLRDSMPGFGTPHNPLDLTGGIEPAQCEQAVRLLGEQPEYAAILCAWYAIPTCREEESPRLAQLHHHLSNGLNTAPIPGLLASYTHNQVNAPRASDHRADARALYRVRPGSRDHRPRRRVLVVGAPAPVRRRSARSGRRRDRRGAAFVGACRARIPGAPRRAGRSRQAGHRRGGGRRRREGDRRSGRPEDRVARHRPQERHRRRRPEPRGRAGGGRGLPAHHGSIAGARAGGADRRRARLADAGARHRAAGRPSRATRSGDRCWRWAWAESGSRFSRTSRCASCPSTRARSGAC